MSHNLRRIARPARSNLNFEVNSRCALNRLHYFKHRKAPTVAAIECQRRRTGSQMFERIGVRAYEIADVDVVADARAVGRRVIVAENVELGT